MEIETEELLLDKCRKLIEEKLGWEDGARWSTHDFEILGGKIQEATGVSLSIATLKRIWGKIRYDSKPTPTTLNTLARYVGYEDWREFRKGQHLNGNGHVNGSSTIERTAKKQPSFIWVAVPLLVVGSAIGAWTWFDKSTTYTPGDFKFSSHKVVDRGVPNSVVFDYDATAATASDSIFIQQSWDKSLTSRVATDQKQHTAIYYYPGFFEAKLVVNQRIMLEHNLLITTDGWLPIIDQPKVPVYLEQADVQKDGMLQLTEETILKNNVPLQPQTPFVGFHYFNEFDGSSDDLIFETRIRNDYGKGGGACQFAEIRIQFAGPAVIIPLSAPGCVSNLGFAGLDGKKNDLSDFGRNMNEWVTVKCLVKQNKGEVFFDGKPIRKFIIPGKVADFSGIGLRFQGPASVDFVKVTESGGRIIFEDGF
jgi:hypothetical protein